MARTNTKVGGRTHDQIDREIYAKHGDDHVTRESSRTWKAMTKLVSHGPAVRIPDGWSMRRYR